MNQNMVNIFYFIRGVFIDLLLSNFNLSFFVLNFQVFVVLGFFTCWAPFHAQRVLAIYTNDDSKSVFMIKLLELTFYVSGKYVLKDI